MPAISNLTRRKIVTTTVDIDGESVQVTFDRNKITPAWVAATQERDREKDALSIPKAFAEVIVEWDITDEAGDPYPPTVENIAVFSSLILGEFMGQIIEASVPGAAEGKDLPATSPVPSPVSTPTGETSRNGHQTSTSPEPSASLSPT